MLEFLVDNGFVAFAGKVFKQIVGIPIGTNCAPLPLLIESLIYTFSAPNRKETVGISVQCHTQVHDDVLSINIREFGNYLDQMYPVQLEIKDTTLSNTFYQEFLVSIGRVNITIQFITNVTFSIFISHTFRSRVAILHIRPSMTLLSHSSCYNPWLARHGEFLKSFSNRITSGMLEIAIEEVLWSMLGSYHTI